jgi:hypothetical protein
MRKLAKSQLGIVTVSMDLLAQMFHFPEGHKIIDVRRRDSDFGTFQILCEGPTLPETTAAEYTPNVQYLVNVTESGEMVRERKYIGHFEAATAEAGPQSEENAA